MALLCDYFVAASDALAALAIDRDGGPGGPATAAPAKRLGLFGRRAGQSAPMAEPAFPTVAGNGIEPVVQMGTLEALLTGRDYEDVMAAHPAGQGVAVRDRGERMVLRLTDSLTAALAGATQDRLTDVAAAWSQTEEFWGQGDPAALAGFLHDLARLARAARDESGHLYCWVCV